MQKGKKSNVAMILIPLVLAATGLYFIFRKKKVVDTIKIDDKKPETVVVEGKEQPINFPLRRGSKGNLVKQLQNALMQYNSALPIGYDDGKFGVKTEGELFKISKKKMVESQAELDSIVRGGQSIANNKKSKVVGVYSPTPTRVDPFNATKNI
jgi:hypothetical protein